MQVFVIVILTIISSLIFGKIKFITPLAALKLSYSKTLGGKLTNEDMIKESLFQLKTIAILLSYLLLVLSPFLMAIPILLVLNLSIENYFVNIQNQLIVLFSFIAFGAIKKYVSK
jgi:hypothetical protein